MNVRGSGLVHRLRVIRVERFGVHGAPVLAWRLGLPTRTWLGYEEGAAVPGRVLRRLIDVTHVEPSWLFHGCCFQSYVGSPAISILLAKSARGV